MLQLSINMTNISKVSCERYQIKYSVSSFCLIIILIVISFVSCIIFIISFFLWVCLNFVLNINTCLSTTLVKYYAINLTKLSIHLLYPHPPTLSIPTPCCSPTPISLVPYSHFLFYSLICHSSCPHDPGIPPFSLSYPHLPIHSSWRLRLHRIFFHFLSPYCSHSLTLLIRYHRTSLISPPSLTWLPVRPLITLCLAGCGSDHYLRDWQLAVQPPLSLSVSDSVVGWGYAFVSSLSLSFSAWNISTTAAAATSLFQLKLYSYIVIEWKKINWSYYIYTLYLCCLSKNWQIFDNTVESSLIRFRWTCSN